MSDSKYKSILDYPLPPVLEKSYKTIRIVFNGVEIVNSQNAIRVLEKGHPPVYYIPAGDIKNEYLVPADNRSFCPWKGEASYYNVKIGDKEARYSCWHYPEPTPEFISIKNYIAFYPQKMDACYLDNEPVTPEPGKYYGGWITKDITVPSLG
ncbi:MAG: DUF427 domain-containing protein [Ignavibacteria bacterium]